MEQTYEKFTQKFKSENQNSEMDIEGTVIKVELKPSLTQIQKLPNERLENANQEEHNVEIKSENQAQNEPSQNALLIEETIDMKLENEDIRSYICGKSLNCEENSFDDQESSRNKTKIESQNICDICNKSFSNKTYLERHVTIVHDELREHKCEICGITFGQKNELQFHLKKVLYLVKPHKCDSCDRSFIQKNYLDMHVKIVHENLRAYTCEFCSRSFSKLSNLEIHIKTVHENIKSYRVTKTIFMRKKCLYLLQFLSYTKIL